MNSKQINCTGAAPQASAETLQDLVQAWPDAGWVPMRRDGSKASALKWAAGPPDLDAVHRCVARGAGLQFMPSWAGLLVIDSDYCKRHFMGDPGTAADAVAADAFAVFHEPLSECRTPGGGWHGYWPCRIKARSRSLKRDGEQVGDLISKAHLATVHDPRALDAALRYRDEMAELQQADLWNFLELFDDPPSAQVARGLEAKRRRANWPEREHWNPAVSDWRTAFPGLRKNGAGLIGGCPVCGDGSTRSRFKVSADGKAYCHNCDPKGAAYSGWIQRVEAIAGFRRVAA